jgi:hypothetical protein
MAWTPDFAIIKPRVIADNILTYWTDETRQTDALTWAGDGSLRLIKTVSQIKATTAFTPYPSVEFADDSDLQEFGNDYIECEYEVAFRFGIQGTSAAVALSNARKYSAAFTSMLVNCPPATLATNSGATAGTVTVQRVATGYDVIKAGNEGKATADFLQEFEIRTSITMTGAAK